MLDSRTKQVIKIAFLVAFLFAGAVLFNTYRYRHDKRHFLRALTDQNRELQQAELQLRETSHMLATAEAKLGFLNTHKAMVQVTAFAGNGSFANGMRTDRAYAVPNHVLPEDKMLSVALSPVAQQKLHARLNDYIVLFEKNTQKARLARFVDTTSADELRPVVDIFFEGPEEAIAFGRQQFLAVNISEDGSPF